MVEATSATRALPALLLALLAARGRAWLIAPKLTVQSNLPLTQALRDATEHKLGKQLERYDKYLQSVSVNLKVEHRALHDTEHRGKEAHIAEVTALCQDKHVMHVTHESDDMYASLDLLADQLGRKLRKYKDRRSRHRQSRIATGDIFEDAGSSEDLMDDEPDVTTLADVSSEDTDEEGQEELPDGSWQLVREKRFPMPPITIEEAIVCLDYVDHNFYVFRSAESGEINVVYRRAKGGVGWIQPSDND